MYYKYTVVSCKQEIHNLLSSYSKAFLFTIDEEETMTKD